MTDYAPAEQARSDILSSGLSKTTIANALALLDRAHPYNGHITLTWENLADLWGLGSRESTRNYLTRLSRAGIIHYTSNQWVYVTFRSWPPSAIDAPKSTRGRVDLRVEGYDSTRGRVKVDTEAGGQSTRGRVGLRVEGYDSTRGRVEKSAHKEYMFVCLFVDPLSTSLEEILNKQTNKQRAAYALLTDPDIAIAELLAADIAAGIDAPAGGYDLDYIQRQVFAWLRDLESGRVTSAGALITRIRRGFQARAITDDDRTTALWQRHFPDDRPTDPSYEWDDLIIR